MSADKVAFGLPWPGLATVAVLGLMLILYFRFSRNAASCLVLALLMQSSFPGSALAWYYFYCLCSTTHKLSLITQTDLHRRVGAGRSLSPLSAGARVYGFEDPTELLNLGPIFTKCGSHPTPHQSDQPCTSQPINETSSQELGRPISNKLPPASPLRNSKPCLFLS